VEAVDAVDVAFLLIDKDPTEEEEEEEEEEGTKR